MTPPQLRAGPRQFLVPGGAARFGQCHAAAIAALPDGDLLAAFFAGSREGGGDTAIWCCRRSGGQWGEPARLFAEPGLAHWNPVLHAEGARVWLFYKVGATVHGWITRVAQSEDGGARWSTPRLLVPGDAAPRGPVKNKPTVLSDGSWLAGGSIEDDRHWDAFADHSSDKGMSWQRHDVPIAHRAGRVTPAGTKWRGLDEHVLWETDKSRTFAWDGVIQPTLWESAPGHVHMLLRSTRGFIYRSDSTDGGRSWCQAYATDLPNNNSGLDLAKRTDGRLVLACNPVAGNWAARSPLALLVSDDNGRRWSAPLPLESEEGEFSYPAIIATGDALQVAYTWNRSNIVHRRIEVPPG